MRYVCKRQEFNERLRGSMLRKVQQYPHYGYKKITRELNKDGWKVNRKRVYKLWRTEGLKVPRRRKKPKNKGHSSHSILRRPAQHINHVWSWDFVSGATTNGRELRWLVVLEEFTRECFYFHPRRSWSAEDILEVLLELMGKHGIPLCIRSDNGPEFTAKLIKDSLTRMGLELLYVEPGSPWQNGAVESLISILRQEFLNEQCFTSVSQATKKSETFQMFYNARRPHGSLGYRTPEEARKASYQQPLATLELSKGSATRAAIDNSYDYLNNISDMELS